MNINFFPQLSNFGSLNKIQKSNNSTNPIQYQKTLDGDTVSFTARKLKYGRRVSSHLREQLRKKQALTEMIDGIKNRGFYKNSPAYVRENKLASAEKELAAIEKYIDETIEFQDSRENAAFLYDPSLTVKQVREEFERHPEFVKLDDLEQEFRSVNLRYFFRTDTLINEGVVDLSYEPNMQNYTSLKAALKGKVSINYLTYQYDLPKGFIKSLVAKRIIDCATVNIDGKEYPLDYVDKGVEDNIGNIKKLIPQKSKYAPNMFSDKPQYAPLWYLAEFGYGSKEELFDLYKRKLIQGKHAIKNDNGRKTIWIDINVNSRISKHNLTVARNRNKNFCFIDDLAKKYNVSAVELERAVIEGRLDTINKYIYPAEAKIGIDLSIPSNQETVNKIAEEAERKRQEEAKSKLTPAEIKRAELEDRGVSIAGLRTAIAWHLSPKTREIGSEIRKKDGYAARVVAKEMKIQERRHLGTESDDEDKPKELTRQEKIKLRSYYKTLWKQAGAEEFSQAMKKANEIAELYLSKGIDAIKDFEIRKIITKYVG